MHHMSSYVSLSLLQLRRWWLFHPCEIVMSRCPINTSTCFPLVTNFGLEPQKKDNKNPTNAEFFRRQKSLGVSTADCSSFICTYTAKPLSVTKQSKQGLVRVTSGDPHWPTRLNTFQVKIHIQSHCLLAVGSTGANMASPNRPHVSRVWFWLALASLSQVFCFWGPNRSEKGYRKKEPITNTRTVVLLMSWFKMCFLLRGQGNDAET